SCINAAFAPVMTGDPLTLQADYVPLSPYRKDAARQPAIVALPGPAPYGSRNIAATSIERSIPDAVGAFVDWLLNQSGWKGNADGGGEPVRHAAKNGGLLVLP